MPSLFRTPPQLPLPKPLPPTPSIIIREKSLLGNIKSMAQKATLNNVRLRPHMKTHKSSCIANEQRQHGSYALTCAKIGEALHFLEEGFTDITLAMPHVNKTKLKIILDEMREKNANINFTIDHVHQIPILDDVVSHMAIDKPVNCYLKIDVGLHRCGIEEHKTEEILNVIRTIQQCKNVKFFGILSHAGHTYGFTNRDAVIKEAKEEVLKMQRVKKNIEENFDIKVEEVSVGATPTELCRDYFEGITEIRPGNYVLMDKTPLRLGLCSVDDVACFVLAQVITKNDRYILIDSGSKVLSSDGGAHGSIASSFGHVWKVNDNGSQDYVWEIASLSEEHGWVQRAEGEANIEVGDYVYVLPNHSCPVMNLTDEFLVINEEGDIMRTEKVHARGKVQ